MASFDRGDPELPGRLDWQILQNGSISLCLDQDIFLKICAWFRNQGYFIYDFDCSLWKTELDFHKSVSQTFKFPEYYGENLDALNDCLIDIEIPLTSGALIAFKHYDIFAKHNAQFSNDVLDILANQTRRFLLFGQRLIILLQVNKSERYLYHSVGNQVILLNPWE